jgi:hypothetical protein
MPPDRKQVSPRPLLIALVPMIAIMAVSLLAVFDIL